MSEAPNPQELRNRVHQALAAMPADDRVRQALEAMLPLLDAQAAGLVITGPVASARDTNIATNQTNNTITVVVPPTSAPIDPKAARLAWLERLSVFYGTPPDAPELDMRSVTPRLLEDLRLRLVRGLIEWPADSPPATIDDIVARSRVALLLWPLITAPLTGNPRYVLPIRWVEAFAAVAAGPLVSLVSEHQKLWFQHPKEALLEHLLTALAQPQYRQGIQNLLVYVRDLARDEQTGAVIQLAQQIPDHLLPPAAAAQATPLRLLALGLGSALAGAGALAALEAASGHADLLLQLVRQLVQQLQSASAPATERPVETASAHPPRVAPNIVRTPSGNLSMPLSATQWRDELARRDEVFGEHGLRQSLVPYWCYVRKDTYTIGGWEKGDPAARIALPKFWIARVPITVAQYYVFMNAGGYATRRWWTPHGWEWKRAQKREHPLRWGDTSFNRATQPLLGVTWYEASAYCAWLHELLTGITGVLPAGYRVSLPSEAEWEAAAAYDADMRRRTYPWGEGAPTAQRAIYDRKWEKGPPDIATCPAGAAACGALDMVGTVWELACSTYSDYPSRSGTIAKDFTPGKYDVADRGGGYWNNSTIVRCGARYGNFPDTRGLNYGFRIVVAARSH
ncbi:MAG TPA: SUMF1/EgtB/PvdO family nonheme iron enzyme [Kouleothrix sp.]|nr:SUMF1/EgtB/PvdO family nonheme iron enzyme [Kouleothrix sp.]